MENDKKDERRTKVDNTEILQLLDSLSLSQLLQQCHIFNTQIDLSTHLYINITKVLIRKLLNKLGIGNDEDDDSNKSEHLRNIIVDCMRHLQSTLDSLLSRLDDSKQFNSESFKLWRYVINFVLDKIAKTVEKKLSNVNMIFSISNDSMHELMILFIFL